MKFFMKNLLVIKHYFFNAKMLLLAIVLLQSFANLQAQETLDSLDRQLKYGDKLNYNRKPNFWLAAGETFGMNVSLWAFDRYILKGHYAYISFETIKQNFKHGFEWDNDHLNTNMFAHPYNGSLFFNAGRS